MTTVRVGRYIWRDLHSRNRCQLHGERSSPAYTRPHHRTAALPCLMWPSIRPRVFSTQFELTKITWEHRDHRNSVYCAIRRRFTDSTCKIKGELKPLKQTTENAVFDIRSSKHHSVDCSPFITGQPSSELVGTNDDIYLPDAHSVSPTTPVRVCREPRYLTHTHLLPLEQYPESQLLCL